VAARALHVVAELGVADALDGDARTAGELAAEVGATPDALDRVLRLLESHGVFSRVGDSGWRHSDSSRLLRSDHPRSLRAFVRMAGTPVSWEPVAALEQAVRAGEPSIHTLDPQGPWAYLDANPAEREVFQQAMTAKARADIAAVLDAYDFSRHRRIADVGGGRGHLIQAVLEAYPVVAGVLFDLPHVIADAAPRSRLQVVAGDLFSNPLPSCDAYVLMNVIHDYDDEQASRILAAIADAGREQNATVLVLEPILPTVRSPTGARRWTSSCSPSPAGASGRWISTRRS
jgi:O-methyltransferase domain